MLIPLDNDLSSTTPELQEAMGWLTKKHMMYPANTPISYKVWGQDSVYFFDARIEYTTDVKFKFAKLSVQSAYTPSGVKFSIQARNRFHNGRVHRGSAQQNELSTSNVTKMRKLLLEATKPLTIKEIAEVSKIRLSTPITAWRDESNEVVKKYGVSSFFHTDDIVKDLVNFRETGVPYMLIKNKYSDAYVDAYVERDRRSNMEPPQVYTFINTDGIAHVYKRTKEMNYIEFVESYASFDKLPSDLSTKCAILKLHEPNTVIEGVGIKDGPFNSFWTWE